MSVVVAWSGGKDAALALHRLHATHDPPRELFTTASAETGRTSMHGLRWPLLDRQADAVGLPLRRVEIPEDASNDAYEETMRDLLSDYADQGVDEIVFADVHLADVRAYREDNLADTPIAGRWPLWGEPTDALAREFVDTGFRAILVCVNDALGPEFLGRTYDRDLLADLPDDVDPCGEGGEFHTFVHDGPVFDHPVEFQRGGTVARDLQGTTFHYLDLA